MVYPIKMFVALALVALASGAQPGGGASWPQWGGPTRDFKAPSGALATAWPAGGPRTVWQRPLGEGYSAIAVADGRLVTLYRTGDREMVIALDPASGKTVWEHAYAAPFLPNMDRERAPGPQATPLIAGGRVYAIGMTAKMHCLDLATGRVLWSHDLWKDFGGTFIDTGYASSPVAFASTVIVMVGGKGHALVAFDQATGKVAWQRQDFAASPSSPVVLPLAGREQLVAFMGKEIVGVDPASGDLLWSHPHVTDWDLNISTPVGGPDDLVFLSSAYGVGSRALQITRTATGFAAKQLWHNPRVRVHKDNAIRVGDVVYASSGDFGASLFTATDVKTGRVLWQDRSFAKASFLYADGKFVILDEDGTLGLASPSATGLQVHAKATPFEGRTWTVPTLVDGRLYVRDRTTIRAFDLGAGAR
jgi:outer membrane protein assembly factor BamB